MKKMIGVMIGCAVAYYVADAICAAGMAVAWGNLVEAQNDPAANALNDVFHKKYCKRDQKIFDIVTDAYLMKMEKNH